MKFKVYRVDDPDNGNIYYSDKLLAVGHARLAKCSIWEIVIDDKKFSSAVDLWVNLLNNENFAEWQKDITKEV